MGKVNYAARELIAKSVYYGPGLCGKTTDLEELHKKVSPKQRGKMLSLATDTDRTLFFDLLPMDLGTIGCFKTKIQLFTVPGQTYYNTTRKMVLKGTDGIVFVADSQSSQMEANIESYMNLGENLKANNLDFETIPLVIQWNKQDMPNLAAIDELNAKINIRNVPSIKAVAVKGEGVLDTFKLIAKEVMKYLSVKVGKGITPAAKVTKPERVDTAPIKIKSERADAYVPESAAGRVARETTLPNRRHDIAGRTMEELGKILASGIDSGSPEARELLKDITKTIASIVEDNKDINNRYEIILRQLNKLTNLTTGSR
ncbi:MAG: hypothetical protein IEMM0002_1449 [bacterium]|nr:MAG: hypothetical protein IEMM0002_1449 [bacterium]